MELWFLVVDPLDQLVKPFPPAADCLIKGIPVARAEDGTIYRLKLVGHHVLCAGATGAGKGSVISAIVSGLSEQVLAGRVNLWVIDPKGGVELAPGRHLYSRFAYGDAKADVSYEASLAALLEEAVQVMPERLDRMRGITRLHTPSTAEPLIVLIIDEIAALTGWITDRTMKRRVESALGLPPDAMFARCRNGPDTTALLFTLTRYGGLFEDGSAEAVDRLDALLGGH